MNTADIQITQLGPGDIDSDRTATINSFLSQLTARSRRLSDSDLHSIVSQLHVKLFVALVDGEITGMLTASVQILPTRKSMTIEDVVVGAQWRRRHLGEMLVEAAERWARSQGVSSIDLTSGASRVEANAMYEKLGYTIRDTNVYRKTL